MDSEQRIVYLQAQILCATIKLEAMKACNQERVIHGEYPDYSYTDFMSVINEYKLECNDIMKFLIGE